jgi:D-methionine transport system permease protein
VDELIFVAVVDMSAQAGLFGGGGIGIFAITYGSPERAPRAG